MQYLKVFLIDQYRQGKTIYPSKKDYFNAFIQTPFEQVKVVIIGQDPYHGPNQAHGLSFSVPKGVKIPPSLLNIYKELESSLKLKRPSHGDLSAWAKQGVLLLNSVLTVENGQAGSHRAQGWERFTDQVIHRLSAKKQKLVFLLWGNYARQKGQIIDRQKHLILEAPHPSPLSARRGFIGCQHFQLTNDYLKKNNQTPINWHLCD